MRRALLFVLLAACSSETPSPVVVDPTSVAAPIVAKLQGQPMTTFATQDPTSLGAKACARGEVAQLEVTVCEFADRAAGEKKMKQLLAGAQSGAVRASGNLVVAVADRQKVDPRGQALNRVLAAIDDQKAN